MIDETLIPQLIWFFILSLYTAAVTLGTKYSYEWMISKNIPQKVAVYYNRKIIHMLAGGVVALITPFIFTTPWLPLLAGLFLTAFTYIPHKTGKIFYWYQTKDNLNDVNFCFMWALIVFILWTITNNPWIAIIPPTFMAFGDGITGIVRNMTFKRRTKHYIGNVFMLPVCLVIAYFIGSKAEILPWAILAAFVATMIERYEYGPIDDNVLITVSSSIILLIGFYL